MIKIEYTDVYGFEAAIRGLRNQMNSWDKSDSYPAVDCGKCGKIEREGSCQKHDRDCTGFECFKVGDNDLALMRKLAQAGDDHDKFAGFINVTMDIVAPLYWWKEFDTYKIGTVSNSCSTMHKIHEKEFTLEDFSHEYLLSMTNNDAGDALFLNDADNIRVDSYDILNLTINVLNYYRERYLEKKDKRYWWQLIQLLPSPYNQRRTVQLNYQVLNRIYHARKNHKLDEWHVFYGWIESLPYFKEIYL